MEKIIAKHILDSIRKHLNNDKLSDEEKLDYITFEAGTTLGDLRNQIVAKIPQLILHVAKQIMFSTLEDWSREIANSYLNPINRYLRKVKQKKFQINFIQETLLLQLTDVKEILEEAVEEVIWKSEKKHLPIPEIENTLTSYKFVKLWITFCEQITLKFGSNQRFTKENVREYLEISVKKAGLDIYFKWK